MFCKMVINMSSVIHCLLKLLVPKCICLLLLKHVHVIPGVLEEHNSSIIRV